MASESSAALAELSSAVATLSAALSPLLATSLVEVVEEGIEPLEKAKLEVTMAYVVHDLIWSESSFLSASVQVHGVAGPRMR